MARVGDFASTPAPVSPDTPGAHIFERFRDEPDTLAIAVVDDADRPVGLVERNAFTLRMSAEFGRALYGRRPAAGFVERLGGVITVDRSTLGGARFTFELRLPLAAADTLEETTAPVAPTPHETLHVLVVDDNPTNRFVAGKVLELFGCSHETASDGREAVERVRAGCFDLVLMDVKMPVMDGVQATRAIRALPLPAAAIPILALTANADPRDEIEYRAAGMDGVAQKPIQPDALLDAIRRVLAEGPEPQAAAA